METTTEKVVRYTRVCHLGKSSREKDHDQRLAHDEAGNWYLYDWSGNAPDRTDDGPLRINFTKPIQIDNTTYGQHLMGRVPVLSGGREFKVGVTLLGLVKMLRIIYTIPASRGGVPSDEQHKHVFHGQPHLVFEGTDLEAVKALFAMVAGRTEFQELDALCSCERGLREPDCPVHEPASDCQGDDHCNCGCNALV